MKIKIGAMVIGMLLPAMAALAAQTALPLASKNAAAAGAWKDATYVGSQACKSCHAKDHAAWKQTWHANMHRNFNPAIVVADFNNVEITYKDVEIVGADKKKVKISPTVLLSKNGDVFSFTLLDKDNPANNQTYNIAYVFGGNWNQHFEAQVDSVVYPTPMRWVVEDKQWTAKPFNDLWWVADGTPDGRPKNLKRCQRQRLATQPVTVAIPPVSASTKTRKAADGWGRRLNWVLAVKAVTVPVVCIWPPKTKPALSTRNS